ncbi:unnamed protein product [Notodromas monacha]|uniref:Uncharacterized protein n=1 Tax=Notodromas monacha TaxID=399045 RepID=A0A7R9BF74_9CRUS|nr:unnamed protein product [Notodromas monacha]CAG0913553.1 unnamed protein product [Notodromas monacha]
MTTRLPRVSRICILLPILLIVYLTFYSRSSSNYEWKPGVHLNWTAFQSRCPDLEWKDIEPWVLPKEASCPKTNHVGFLKTHKCASTTLQNLFLRYAKNNQLNIVLPKYGNYLSRKIPFDFHMAYWHRLPKDGFHVVAHHMIWNFQAVSKLLGPDARYVTILREPVNQFESMFSYSDMSSIYGASLEAFSMFSNKTDKMYSKRIGGNIGRNQMLFDLGFKPEDFDDDCKVMAKIIEVDRSFDLVLLVERFEESIVLMKHLLCWDWEDVAYFQLNSRKSSSAMPEKIRNALSDWLKSDEMLYVYFREKFEKTLKAMNPELFSADLKYLLMGIRGLATFVENHGCLTIEQLQNTTVVVDGLNLIFHLVALRESKMRSPFGGEYDGLRECLTSFIDVLRSKGITPIVIFDGGLDINGQKFKTKLSRMGTSVFRIAAVNPGNPASVFAQHVVTLVIQTLQDLCVTHHVAAFEADGIIAWLAYHLKCPVVSDDSDFFIYGVNCVKLGSLVTACVANFRGCKTFKEDHALEVAVFSPDKFLAQFKIKREHLPVFGSVLGNDVVPFMETVSGFSQIAKHAYSQKGNGNMGKVRNNSRHAVIAGFLSWLARCDPERALDKFLDFLQYGKRDKVREIVLKSIRIYEMLTKDVDWCPETFAPTASDILQAENALLADEKRFHDTCPAWLLARLRKSNHDWPRYLNALMFRVLFVTPVVESYSLETCYVAAFPMIQKFFDTLFSSVLAEGEEVVVNVYARRRLERSSVLGKFPFNVTARREWKIEEEDDPCLLRQKFLSMIELASYEEEIKKIDPEEQVFLLSVVLWMRNQVFPVSVEHLLAAIATHLVLFDLEYKAGIKERKAGPLERISDAENQAVSAKISCIRFFSVSTRVVEDKRCFDADIVSYYEALKAITGFFMTLSAIFAEPFGVIRPERHFSGIFFYTLTTELRACADPLKLLKSKIFSDNAELGQRMDEILNWVISMGSGQTLETFLKDGRIAGAGAKKKRRRNRKKVKDEQDLVDEADQEEAVQEDEEFEDFENKFTSVAQVTDKRAEEKPAKSRGSKSDEPKPAIAAASRSTKSKTIVPDPEDLTKPKPKKEGVKKSPKTRVIAPPTPVEEINDASSDEVFGASASDVVVLASSKPQENIEEESHDAVDVDNYEDDFEDYESDFESNSEDEEEDSQSSSDAKEDASDDEFADMRNEDKKEDDEGISDAEPDLAPLTFHDSRLEADDVDSGHSSGQFGGKMQIVNETDLAAATAAENQLASNFVRNLATRRNAVAETLESSSSSRQMEQEQQHAAVVEEKRRYDFSSAKKRQKSFVAAGRVAKRGAELMDIVRLESSTADLFELEPFGYDAYIRRFGKSNMRQIGVSTADDTEKFECQTEPIKYATRWVQFPACISPSSLANASISREDFLGVGKGTNPLSSEDIDDDREDSNHNEILDFNDFVHSRCGNGKSMSEFMEAAGRLMLRILHSAPGIAPSAISAGDDGFNGEKIHIAGRKVQFCEGPWTRMTTTLVQFSEFEPKLLVTCHAGKEGEDLLILWDVREPSNPLAIMRSVATVTCIGVGPTLHGVIVVAGTSTGALCLWDTQEPIMLHEALSIDKDDGGKFGFGVRGPSYVTLSTKSKSENSKPGSKVCCLKILSQGENVEKRSGFQMISMTSEGVVDFWLTNCLQSNPEIMQLEADPGLAFWSKTALIRMSNTIDVGQSVFSEAASVGDDLVLPEAFKCQDFAVEGRDASQIYICTDSDLGVAHVARSGGKAFPRSYRPDDGRLTEACCVASFPFGHQFLLVGTNDGAVKLFAGGSDKPITHWTVAEYVPIVKVQWAPFRPLVFFALDETGVLHAWDLNQGDLSPIYVVSLKSARIVDFMIGNVVKDSSTKLPAYFALALSDGQTLAGELHETLLPIRNVSTEEELEKFLHYVSIL